jgi:hypothetical protein
LLLLRPDQRVKRFRISLSQQNIQPIVDPSQKTALVRIELVEVEGNPT